MAGGIAIRFISLFFVTPFPLLLLEVTKGYIRASQGGKTSLNQERSLNTDPKTLTYNLVLQ